MLFGRRNRFDTDPAAYDGLGFPVALRFAVRGNLSTGTDQSSVKIPDSWPVARPGYAFVACEGSMHLTNLGTTSGGTRVTITNVNTGEVIYDDTMAYNAAAQVQNKDMRGKQGTAQKGFGCKPGDVLRLDIPSLPGGGTPANLEVTLFGMAFSVIG